MREKRAHQRTDFTVSVEVLLPSGEARLTQSRDLSVGGIFLEGETPLAIGAMITLKLDLPGLGSCTLPGYVRWMRQDGYGVQFGLIGARETHAIGKLVRMRSEDSLMSG